MNIWERRGYLAASSTITRCAFISYLLELASRGEGGVWLSVWIVYATVKLPYATGVNIASYKQRNRLCASARVNAKVPTVDKHRTQDKFLPLISGSMLTVNSWNYCYTCDINFPTISYPYIWGHIARICLRNTSFTWFQQPI